MRRTIFLVLTATFLAGCGNTISNKSFESEGVRLAKAESSACPFNFEPDYDDWCSKNEAESSSLILRACSSNWINGDQIFSEIALRFDQIAEKRCFNEMSLVQENVQATGCNHATKSPIGSYQSSQFIIRCYDSSNNLTRIEGFGPGNQPFKFILRPR